MGPDFAPDELPAIEQFIATLRGDLRFAIELRQSRWMGSDVLPHLLELLTHHGTALALNDGTPSKRVGSYGSDGEEQRNRPPNEPSDPATS
jgi:hypothetical protein